MELVQCRAEWRTIVLAETNFWVVFPECQFLPNLPLSRVYDYLITLKHVKR
jgi:hypothetical protein